MHLRSCIQPREASGNLSKSTQIIPKIIVGYELMTHTWIFVGRVAIIGATIRIPNHEPAISDDLHLRQKSETWDEDGDTKCINL